MFELLSKYISKLKVTPLKSQVAPPKNPYLELSILQVSRLGSTQRLQHSNFEIFGNATSPSHDNTKVTTPIDSSRSGDSESPLSYFADVKLRQFLKNQKSKLKSPCQVIYEGSSQRSSTSSLS